MKKIAHKFLLVVSILVVVSLVTLQILSSNITSIGNASTRLLEKEVQDMTLVQTISQNGKEIHRYRNKYIKSPIKTKNLPPYETDIICYTK